MWRVFATALWLKEKVTSAMIVTEWPLLCRDRPSLPFRCLDPQYRRELVRVYLTNVEGICRRFVDEKRESLLRIRETAASFKAYWISQSASDRKTLVQHKGSDMLKVMAHSVVCMYLVSGWHCFKARERRGEGKQNPSL